MTLLTTDKAREYLADRGINIAKSTLVGWRSGATNQGPAFSKVARRVYYSEADLDAWLEQQLEAGRVEGGA